MDEKSRAQLRELSNDRYTRVSFDGGSELNGLLRGRIAELEAAIRKYGNEWYADLLDENKLNQARRNMFALVRR